MVTGKMKRLFSILTVLAFAYTTFAQTKVIAHRGYWDTNGSAQNSIRSLIKADSIGCYGSEFDVWMTADNQLIVNHDAKIEGHKIETSYSADILACSLSNGEKVPSLEQYLTVGKKCTTRLILELKPHTTAERENIAVKKILALVDSLKLNDRMEYISFSLNACKQFIASAPKGTPVFYLNGELPPSQLKVMGFAGFDYNLSTFYACPTWIEDAHRIGLKVNFWTVNKEKDLRRLVNAGADFITTNNPELLQQIIADSKKNKIVRFHNKLSHW